MRTIKTVGLRPGASHVAWVPGSKSYTNRALIIAAQRMGTTHIKNALICDDTSYLAAALASFGGLSVIRKGRDFVVTRSLQRLQAPVAPLYVGGAGTPARFLIGFATTAEGETTVSGNARLSERPMGDLLHSLRSAGFDCRAGSDCLPITVRGGSAKVEDWTVSGEISSQFLSSLLLLATQQRLAQVHVTVTGHLVSVPYVNMTIAMLIDCGIRVEQRDAHHYTVVPGAPSAPEIMIEPDASAMSYALTAAALTRSRVQVNGIGRRSAQGDVGLVEAYGRMGCKIDLQADSVQLTGAPLRGIDIDMEAMPDVVLSLAMAATQASSPTRITNIGNLRVKECDRIAAIAKGLAVLGIRVDEGADSLVIYPGRPRAGVVPSHDDHRVAMAFSLLGLIESGVEVDDPGCVKKSFPEFWDEMSRQVQSLEGSDEALQAAA